MKCDKCDNMAHTILDLACDTCGIRLCKECAAHLKCYYCRIPYCECKGVFCPNVSRLDQDNIYWWHSSLHDKIDGESFPTGVSIEQDLKDLKNFWDAYDNDAEFIKQLPMPMYGGNIFTCDNETKKAGKLSIELARRLVKALNWYGSDRIERIADRVNWHVDNYVSNYTRCIGNEELHREADLLWQWYIESMNLYTMDEARDIAKIILTIDRDEYWYA